jgi:CspA family cold shock protein
MSEGVIKKLTDKGFGFIERDSGDDLFFHRSSVEGNYDSLREGQRVEFTEGMGQKGPCAESVRSLD